MRFVSRQGLHDKASHGRRSMRVKGKEKAKAALARKPTTWCVQHAHLWVGSCVPIRRGQKLASDVTLQELPTLVFLRQGLSPGLGAPQLDDTS